MCLEAVLQFHECQGAHGVVVSHAPRMRKALGSNPSVSIVMLGVTVTPPCCFYQRVLFLWQQLFTKHFIGNALLYPHRAHGVVVSHPLRMRKALGSIPSVSISFHRARSVVSVRL